MEEKGGREEGREERGGKYMRGGMEERGERGKEGREGWEEVEKEGEEQRVQGGRNVAPVSPLCASWPLFSSA